MMIVKFFTGICFLCWLQTNEYPLTTGGPPNKLTSGGTPRFRIYDTTGILPNQNNPWYDLLDPVLYDQWNKLAIQYTVSPTLGGSVVTVS